MAIVIMNWSGIVVMSVRSKMQIKFFCGRTSFWGFGIEYDTWSKSFGITFICWYISVEFWSNQDA